VVETPLHGGTSRLYQQEIYRKGVRVRQIKSTYLLSNSRKSNNSVNKSWASIEIAPKQQGVVR